MNFAKILKENRKQQGISLDDLAIKAGVCKRSLIYWEQGRDISLKNAEKVCCALGIKLKIGA